MSTQRLYLFFQRRFLPGRMRRFNRLLRPPEGATILDIGGTAAFWQDPRWRNSGKVTLLNIEPPPDLRGDDFQYVQGDATSLPFPDKSFDIVFSNSMIEHLYTRANQVKAAREAMRVGTRLWIQTPNRWFPVEPHFLTPFIHWLPTSWRRRLVRNFTVWGLITRPTSEAAAAYVDEIRLLSANDLSELFPGSRVVRERVLGFTKSLIAIR